MNITKTAYNSFTSQKYFDALLSYMDLSDTLGEHLFKANLKICQNRCPVCNVVYITDESYAMPTYVSLCSLLRNINYKIGLKYHIYIIAQKFKSSTKLCFEHIHKENVDIKIIEIKDDFEQFAILKKGFHVSTAAILKFKLPSLLKNIDKILYLDSDTIIQNDINELFYIDIENFYAGVVNDVKPLVKYKPNMLKKLNILNHAGYFNSGMMLLNLKKMREDHIAEKLFQYRTEEKNYFMDQDAFNVVIGGNVKYLDLKYNLLVTLENEFTLSEIKKYYLVQEKYKSFTALAEDSVVIHYASKNKPWNSNLGDVDYFFDKNYILSNVYNYFSSENTYALKSLIVSLTSYPKRINTIHQCIRSLLDQSVKPQTLILWLAEEQFPRKEQDLPESLLSLTNEGLTISWCNDLKSYKKIIPTLKQYPDSIIVTADDDIIYPRDWLLQLIVSYIRNPQSIHCHRAHRVKMLADGYPASYQKWDRAGKNISVNSSYRNFFTGVGGVLYPPHSLFRDVTRDDIFMQQLPSGDDIWLWGMALLQGTKIQRVRYSDFSLNFVEGSQEFALHRKNDQGGMNDVMIKNLLSIYPQLLMLFQENTNDN